jgi:hypothetical protein
MELTFVNDFGQSFVIEIDPNMELENVMALVEAEVRSALARRGYIDTSPTVRHTRR